MSVHVISWVLDNSETTKGDRLVLLAIADHASPDGTDSWASVGTLAQQARLSERATRYALRSLEAAGAIVDTGTGPRGTHNYTVVMGQKLPGAKLAGGQSETEGGQPTAPEPSLEPSSQSVEAVLDSSLTAKEPRGVPRARRPWKVDRREVTYDEAALAGDVLAEWNEQTGQQLTATDWHSKIILRIREHPDLTLTDHAHVIAAALAEPWWDGHPSPSVVYGNGAQFERCITAARNGPAPKREPLRYGRGLTTRQILELGRTS